LFDPEILEPKAVLRSEVVDYKANNVVLTD